MSYSKAQQRKAATRFFGTGLITDEKAALYGPELARLAAASGGVVSPAEVVTAASHPRSPLHEWVFQYSDSEAVQRHRLEQATYLVRHVVEVIVDEASGEEVQVRPFLHSAEVTGYVERCSMPIADWQARRVEQAYAELRSFVRRYADLEEVAAVVRQVRKLLDAV